MQPDAGAATAGYPFRHVDVFTDSSYRGNGLIVVFADSLDHTAEQLRLVAAEMRQFETIFVTARGTDVVARIFTVEEELPFAGHPVLGAAAALHERAAPDEPRVRWTFHIGDRQLPVVSAADDVYFTATMDQGVAQIAQPLPQRVTAEAAVALGLEPHQLAPLPVQVVSTGLPYLIVPVTGPALAYVRISRPDFEAWLGELGAKFVYALDVEAREGRTWDNAGAVEDVATGSAAGPAAAYLISHGLADPAQPVVLHQGRFVGRASTITVAPDRDGHLWVGGPVRPVAAGSLDSLPASAAG